MVNCAALLLQAKIGTNYKSEPRGFCLQYLYGGVTVGEGGGAARKRGV
jgi:hypothetical protein